MKVYTHGLLLASILFQKHSVAVATEDQPCAPVTTAPNFDLEKFMSQKWYAHQVAPTKFEPVELHYCKTSKYSMRKTKTRPWGYEVQVDNYSEYANGDPKDATGMCATIYDDAKLGVAPCFIPRVVSGAFWILAFDDKRGYALVSGGQPTVRSKEGTGCTSGGLWIYTRSGKRDEKLLKEIRDMATSMDIDVSVLNDIDQTNCDHKSGSKSGEEL